MTYDIGLKPIVLLAVLSTAIYQLPVHTFYNPHTKIDDIQTSTKTENSINEIGVVLNKIAINNRVNEAYAFDNGNRGLQAVNSLMDITQDALNAKQKNGMTGFEIMSSGPIQGAVNFSEAISGTKANQEDVSKFKSHFNTGETESPSIEGEESDQYR